MSPQVPRCHFCGKTEREARLERRGIFTVCIDCAERWMKPEKPKPDPDTWGAL